MSDEMLSMVQTSVRLRLSYDLQGLILARAILGLIVHAALRHSVASMNFKGQSYSALSS
jgi:hypothetical protein